MTFALEKCFHFDYFRQQDDAKWIQTPQRVRRASLSKEDINVLSSLQISNHDAVLAADATRNFYTNAYDDSFNDERLNSLQGQLFVSTSSIRQLDAGLTSSMGKLMI